MASERFCFDGVTIRTGDGMESLYGLIEWRHYYLSFMSLHVFMTRGNGQGRFLKHIGRVYHFGDGVATAGWTK